jgi:hypothetical protein
MHPFPGTFGILVGALIPAALWCVCFFPKPDVNYYLDANGEPKAFEPFLAKYLKVSELIISLATGSIVLLIGSSSLSGGHEGRLPWFYASPLFILAFSVLYAIAFSVWMTFHYEMYQHDKVHSRKQYAFSETLGFSAVVCFLIGYIWLIASVVR